VPRASWSVFDLRSRTWQAVRGMEGDVGEGERDQFAAAVRAGEPQQQQQRVGERDFSGEVGREHRVDPGVECPIGVDPNHASGGHAASALTVVSGARVKLGYQRWKSSASWSLRTRARI
jgi:hypothetical protein